MRVIAGLDQPPILYHSEDWPGHATAELGLLRGAMGGGDGDALVVVWGPERDVHTAAEEIRLRYVDATDGVPNETRQPFADGHTDFERILPGPDRMYPDTDSPPTRVTRERVDRLRAGSARAAVGARGALRGGRRPATASCTSSSGAAAPRSSTASCARPAPTCATPRSSSASG